MAVTHPSKDMSDDMDMSVESAISVDSEAAKDVEEMQGRGFSFIVLFVRCGKGHVCLVVVGW